MSNTNITEEHKALFEALRDPDFTNFALVHTTFDGEPTSAIAAITRQDGIYQIAPVAVIVTEKMFMRMTNPELGLEDTA